MHARVKIGVSTYNDRGFLELVLQSIRWYTYLNEPYDLVVCDDGSKGEHLEYVRDVCDRFKATLILHEENRGIPTTWNHLVMSLGNEAEIIVLLNNDLILPPDWLRVGVHFLDANKDNPHVGSMFWNPINQVPMGMMRAILPELHHTTYVAQDTATGKQRDFTGSSPMAVRVGDGQGLGRVMCPCGCCFAFRREVFMECGPFHEDMVSFHEESHFGTTCAAHGRASFGFAYPRPYHGVGQTFGANPELKAQQRMRNSRSLYRQLWGVPEDVPDTSYFEHVHNRLMPAIPKTMLKYLRPDYSLEPEALPQSCGGTMHVPRLVEFCEEF